jgi:DNA 3'-phosphatase
MSDAPDGAPAAKRPKVEASSPAAKKQTSLTSFFGGGKPKDASKNKEEPSTSTYYPSATRADTTDTKITTPKNPLDAIIPAPTPISSSSWRTYSGCVLLRRARKDAPRDKVAAFDLDGTLLVWRSASWPSQLDHYELWNATVFGALRQRYDEGYKLLLVSNQGAIRSAFTGKNAKRVQTIVEWIVQQVDRPVHVIMSTDKKGGYHKPSKEMWTVAEEELNGGVRFNVNESFFVGDSTEDNPDDPQGGVDSRFAKNVGAMNSATLKFSTPDEYFGPSTASRRKISGDMAKYESPPKGALGTMAALSGGYMKGPILLILCGVQGSGKSTFCNNLLEGSSATWMHMSQDTINNGKPGKREQVEAETSAALKNGKSVVVDRMHLDVEQRSHFIHLAKQSGVPVHALLLQPPKDVVLERVKTRTNHPAGVEGEKGARIASISIGRVVVPSYKEGLDFLTAVGSEGGVAKLVGFYKRVSCRDSRPSMPSSFSLVTDVVMPSVALGTMKVGKRIADDTISTAIKVGVRAVDTAPTYNNEAEIGANLAKDTFVIVKVPKRAVQPADVRKELTTSLSSLRRDTADLLLLHWPSDVISADTLKPVWQEMESLVKEGLVRAIGVCNFNVDALRRLLPGCSIRPAVNQVERHPMLPQWELIDFCFSQGILVQAHSPLGQGSSDLLGHATIKDIAKMNKLTPAQVVLQWNLLHGVAVIPKCTSKQHLAELSVLLKGDSVLLPPSAMKALDCINERKRFLAPPFMYSSKAIYAWGDRMPTNK